MEIIQQITPEINPLSGPQTAAENRAQPAPQAGEAAYSVKISNLPSVQQKKLDTSTLRIVRYRRQAEARKLLPDQPVAWCCRRVAIDPETRRRLDNLPIKKSASSEHFYTGGHWACHSNPCPVCQARRAGVFLGRLLPALEVNAARFIYGMDTLTASTNAAMTAGDFVPKFKRALSRFTGGRWWADFRERWHIRGWVTGQDFTQKSHGPHFHIHRLIIMDRAPFFVDRPSRRALNANILLAARWAAFDWNVTSIAVLQGIDKTAAALMHADAAQRWVNCCEAEGLIADLDYGYHIEGGDHKVAHYIAKLALEVTQSGNKRGRGGWTLGELLDQSARGNRQAGDFWRQAQEALKGTAILRASKGLWALLEVEEPTDADLAAGDQTSFDELIALLPVEDWYAILNDDRREEYFAALCLDDLKSLQDFARSAGVRLYAPDAQNALQSFKDAQGGNYKLINVDLDNLISFADFDF